MRVRSGWATVSRFLPLARFIVRLAGTACHPHTGAETRTQAEWQTWVHQAQLKQGVMGLVVVGSKHGNEISE